MNTAISVIMPVYNAEKFLYESIESILNQGFKDFEFIIIDDCSTDSSNEIIKTFANQDERIKLYVNEKNIGLTKSLNSALTRSRGKYIARMDADDISLRERFQFQFDFLEENQEVFLVGGWAVEVNPVGKQGEKMTPETNLGKLQKKLNKENNIIHPTIFFRNQKNLFYREKFYYAQDYDFYLNLLSSGKKLINLSKILLKYRVYDESISIVQKPYQRFFTEKAKQFYHERKAKTYDSYDNFVPEQEFNLAHKTRLEAQVHLALKLFKTKEIRKYCLEYFQKYGIFNKFLFYYGISYFSKSIYLKIKKTLSL